MLLLAVETDWSSLVWFVCLSGLFCLSLISRLYGAGNCWHRLSNSLVVHSDLLKSGFVPNEDKSQWEPTQIITQ